MKRERRGVKEIETSLTYKSLVILFPGLIFLFLIADAGQTEYCTLFHCVRVCPSTGVTSHISPMPMPLTP